MCIAFIFDQLTLRPSFDTLGGRWPGPGWAAQQRMLRRWCRRYIQGRQDGTNRRTLQGPSHRLWSSGSQWRNCKGQEQPHSLVWLGCWWETSQSPFHPPKHSSQHRHTVAETGELFWANGLKNLQKGGVIHGIKGLRSINLRRYRDVCFCGGRKYDRRWSDWGSFFKAYQLGTVFASDRYNLRHN